MKVYIHTLGCKVNQYESQAMELILSERGHEICRRDGEYDAFIVNTCAVTAESGRKSRQAVRNLKAARPNSVCAVCGCFSQISADDAEKLGADIVFGSGDRLAFIDALEKAYAEKTKTVNVDNALSRRVFEELPSGNIGTRTRATLKIEDGCSNFCTYCIIPYARGPVRSLPLNKISAQAKHLCESGYKEIVITGIEIGSYGKDLDENLGLADAIEAVSLAAPGVRIRLGSLEPRTVTEDFCKRLSALGTVCPHFHLSLQSGCDDTLRRMNRKYDTARFYESVVLLREYFPDCGLTADLIVGFPTETEENLAETLDFIKKCAFSDMHVFPYSIRPGTMAAKMKPQLTAGEKHRRAMLAGKVASDMAASYKASCVGKTLSVLFETEKDGYFYGHGGNYVLVRAKGENLHNRVHNVLITKAYNDFIEGEII